MIKKDYSLRCRMANRNFSDFTVVGMIRVGIGNRERIEEYSRGFLERDSMFAQVCFCLFRVPLVDHRLSLPFISRQLRANAPMHTSSTLPPSACKECEPYRSVAVDNRSNPAGREDSCWPNRRSFRRAITSMKFARAIQPESRLPRRRNECPQDKDDRENTWASRWRERIARSRIRSRGGERYRSLIRFPVLTRRR